MICTLSGGKNVQLLIQIVSLDPITRYGQLEWEFSIQEVSYSMISTTFSWVQLLHTPSRQKKIVKDSIEKHQRKKEA